MSKIVYRNRIMVVLADKMITNTYIAAQLGMSKMTVSRWTTNAAQPNVSRLIEISKVLDCKLDDLLEPYE